MDRFYPIVLMRAGNETPLNLQAAYYLGSKDRIE
jgi:hypothetical protein